MQGRWLRALEYVVRDGYIRAVGPGADDFEEYDPWTEYYEGRLGTLTSKTGRRTDLPSPYMSLVELTKSLPSPQESPLTLTSDQEAAIVHWYEGHGSLGLLSQRTSTAVLYPGMDLAPEDVEHDDGTVEFVGVPALSQVVYLRTSRGWVRDRNYVEGSREALQEQTRGKITLDIREPMVVMAPLDRSRPEALGLAEAWGPYFPDVPAHRAGKHPYPLPNTPKFWLSSGEPVAEFIAAVHLLAKVADLGKGGDSRGTVAKRRILEALLSPAGVSVQSDSAGGLVQRWQAPSLLGMYAMMMLLDLTAENAPLRICPACSTPFVNRHAEYCSLRCANRQRVETHRDNVDAAWRYKREGLSNAEIAERMGATSKRVEDWLMWRPRKGKRARTH